jgi:hypothetical protein
VIKHIIREVTMAFGKAFKTRKEAEAHLKKLRDAGKDPWKDLGIRRLSKKLFPRRTKVFHVGSHLDFLNFA